jgi:hypothetical protein
MDSYLPDYYHANFNDGALPLSTILSDTRIVGIILKYTEGTSYAWDYWGSREGARVRSSRAVLGGYHMLSGADGTGTEQARYFLAKYQPKAGDIAPAVDFESSGQNGRGDTSLATYKAKLIDFIAEVHRQGFECMLYGHSVVKAAFSDWRSSGADYWWCPGSQLWTDVGPKGPDLWQYSPYSSPSDWPTNPAGKDREDVSKVVTVLPVIGPTEDEMAFADYQQGTEDYRAGKDLNVDWPTDRKKGWTFARWAGNNPPTTPPASLTPHTHDMPAKSGGVSA